MSYAKPIYIDNQKEKEKGSEINFISDEPEPSFHGLNDNTHLDVIGFLGEPESIGDIMVIFLKKILRFRMEIEILGRYWVIVHD